MEKINYKIKKILHFLKLNYLLIKYKIRFYIFNLFKIEGIKNNEEKIIVSLTSIPSRLSKLYLCLETILEQSKKPDKIILYLGNNVKEEEIPNKIKKLQKRGLTIEFREDKRLKPHTKYFYAMQEYPNNIVITFDDDILYHKDIIEKLYNSYKQYPKCVSCMRAHKITFDENDKIRKYNDWEFEYVKDDSIKPSSYLCATGVGSVLYPAHIMPLETFDNDKIVDLSLNADDLWLKVMQIKNNIKVVRAVVKKYYLYVIPSTQKITLNEDNVINERNDEIMKKLINYYGITKKNFERGDK